MTQTTEQVKEYRRQYYQANRNRLDKLSRKYRLEHLQVINEQNRVRKLKKLGKPVKPLVYSFARHFIGTLQKSTLISARNKKLVWDILLSLDLTAQQRELVKLAINGNQQRQVAKLWQINQSTVCKMWNGQMSYRYKKRFGGIYPKFLAALTREMKTYFQSLHLRYE